MSARSSYKSRRHSSRRQKCALLTTHTHTFFGIIFIQFFFLPHPCEAVHLAAVTTTPNPFSLHREPFTLNAVVVTYPLPGPPPPPCFSTNFYRGTRHTHTTDAHNHNNNLYSLLTLKTWHRHITHPPSAAEDWCSYFFTTIINNSLYLPIYNTTTTTKESENNGKNAKKSYRKNIK